MMVGDVQDLLAKSGIVAVEARAVSTAVGGVERTSPLRSSAAHTAGWAARWRRARATDRVAKMKMIAVRSGKTDQLDTAVVAGAGIVGKPR